MTLKQRIVARIAEIQCMLAASDYSAEDLTLWELQIRLEVYQDVLTMMGEK